MKPKVKWKILNSSDSPCTENLAKDIEFLAQDNGKF